MINSWIQSSVSINASFDIHFINISFSDDTRAIGKFSFRKVGLIFILLFRGLYILKKNRPDIILYNCAPSGFAFYRDVLFSLSIKLFSHAPLAYHIHGKSFIHNANQSVIYNVLCNWLYKNSYAICLSEGLANDVRPFPIHQSYVLNNGIPRPGNIHIKPKSGSPLTFLFLSNFVITKGLIDFIQALGMLKKQATHPFKFILIGAEFDITNLELRSMFKVLDLENSLLHMGPLYGDEKLAMMNNADILVFPTYYENECFPLVILEAFQSGLPAISTFEGAIPEIIQEGSTGFLVKSRNPQALAERMLYLLQNSSVIPQMRQNALIAFDSKFSFDIFEKKFISIIQSILKADEKQ